MAEIPKIDWPKEWDPKKGWVSDHSSKPLKEKRGWSAFDAALRAHYKTSLSRIQASLRGDRVSRPDLFSRAARITLVQLKKEMKRLKITAKGEYQKMYKEIPGAPCSPDKSYPDWISWPDLFGRKVEDRIPLVQLKREVKHLGITTAQEYRKRYREIPGAPAAPSEIYPEWISWNDLFGREHEDRIRITLVQLKKEVERLKITSEPKYKKRYNEIPGAPSNPDKSYPDWISWHDLFGRTDFLKVA